MTIRSSLRRALRRLRPGPVLPPPSGWQEVERVGFRWHLCLDHYLDRELFRRGTWEGHATERVREIVTAGMTALDVGANFGYFSLLLARQVGPTGTVIAFEPTLEYSSRLRWHLSANRIENVRLECQGLSDRTGEAWIAVGDSSATLHWSRSDAPRSREQVRLVRLDDWWDAYVAGGGRDRLDFAKVDLDGHELQFLEGGARTLLRHRPVLVVEFSQELLHVSGRHVWDLADALEGMGYRLCSEKTGDPFAGRSELLREAGNFAFSANVLARPSQAPQERLGTGR